MLPYMTEEVEAEIKRTIPWARIEPRIRPLVQSLNEVAGIATEGSCEGHIEPLGDDAFRVEPAHIALRVSQARFTDVLEGAVATGIGDVALRFFPDGWFWMLLSWDPGDYRPIYDLARRLKGEQAGEGGDG